MSSDPSPPRTPADPRRDARNRLLWTTAGLFIAATLAFVIRGTLTSNELDTLQTARRWVDPNWIPGDWFLDAPQGPRRPFQVLISPLVAALPLPWVSLVGRMLGYLFLAVSTARLTVRLGIAPGFVVAAGGLFVLQGQCIASGEWLIGHIESKVVAYGLILLGLRAWLDDRRAWMGAAFGAATTMHVLVGVQATFALGLALLLERPWKQHFREHLRALASWTAIALPGLAIALDAARDKAPSDPPMSWIYVVFRVPHHADPLTWHLPWYTIAWALGLVAVLVVTLLREHKNIDKQRLARFGLATLVLFVAGLIAAFFPHSHKFLQFLPFRVGSLMLPFLGLLLAVSFVEKKIPLRWVRAVACVGAGVTLVFAAVRFRHAIPWWRTYPEGGRPVAERELATVAMWLRDHGAKGGVLASPTHESIGYLTRRPVVVTFAQVPPNRSGVLEWYRRILDLSGNANLTHRGFSLMSEIDKHFEELPAAELQALAKRYQMTVLLTRRKTPLDWPLVYQQGVWSAYEIPQ